MVIRDKGLERRIATERIEILFGLAKEQAGKRGGLSKRYVSLMRKMSSHYKVSIPKEMKLAICKSCNDIIVPGINGTVRLASTPKRILYICSRCGSSNSLIYSKSAQPRA